MKYEPEPEMWRWATAKHMLVELEWDDLGRYGRCSCGHLMRGPTTDALSLVVGEHITEHLGEVGE